MYDDMLMVIWLVWEASADASYEPIIIGWYGKWLLCSMDSLKEVTCMGVSWLRFWCLICCFFEEADMHQIVETYGNNYFSSQLLRRSWRIPAQDEKDPGNISFHSFFAEADMVNMQPAIIQSRFQSTASSQKLTAPGVQGYGHPKDFNPQLLRRSWQWWRRLNMNSRKFQSTASSQKLTTLGI